MTDKHRLYLAVLIQANRYRRDRHVPSIYKMPNPTLLGEAIDYAIEALKFHEFHEFHNNVDHPRHYTSHPSGIECIDIVRHYCFDIGNAIKYLWRCGLKKEEGMSDLAKEIEDLKKARWYIDDRIKTLEKGLR